MLYNIVDKEGVDSICGQCGCHNLIGKKHRRMPDVDSKKFDKGNYHSTYLTFSDLHHIALHDTEVERKLYS